MMLDDVAAAVLSSTKLIQIECSSSRAAQEGTRASARHTISIHITMEFGGYLDIFSECGKKKTTRARALKGEAQGVLSYQKATGIFDNPHLEFCFWAPTTLLNPYKMQHPSSIYLRITSIQFQTCPKTARCIL